MRIKVILFDLDDTLMPEEAAERAVLTATCNIAERQTGIGSMQLADDFRRIALDLWQEGPAHNYCQAIGIGPWEGLWGRFEGDDEQLAILRRWMGVYRRNAWSRCLMTHGIADDDLSSHLIETYIHERSRRHVPYPEVIPTLTKLQARFSCLVVTNGAPDVQREKLRASGLDQLIASPVISGDPGIRAGKPHPRIFRTAIERSGCETSETVMVGDSWGRDICGARRLGMAAVWVNRADCPKRRRTSNIPTIDSLGLLDKALDQLQQ